MSPSVTLGWALQISSLSLSSWGDPMCLTGHSNQWTLSLSLSLSLSLPLSLSHSPRGEVNELQSHTLEGNTSTRREAGIWCGVQNMAEHELKSLSTLNLSSPRSPLLFIRCVQRISLARVWYLEWEDRHCHLGVIRTGEILLPSHGCMMTILMCVGKKWLFLRRCIYLVCLSSIHGTCVVKKEEFTVGKKGRNLFCFLTVAGSKRMKIECPKSTMLSKYFFEIVTQLFKYVHARTQKSDPKRALVCWQSVGSIIRNRSSLKVLFR